MIKTTSRDADEFDDPDDELDLEDYELDCDEEDEELNYFKKYCLLRGLLLWCLLLELLDLFLSFFFPEGSTISLQP